MEALATGLGGLPSTQVKLQEMYGWYPEDHLQGPGCSLTQGGCICTQNTHHSQISNHWLSNNENQLHGCSIIQDDSLGNLQIWNSKVNIFGVNFIHNVELQ